RWVFAVEQFEQRFGQGAGDLGFEAGDLAPAGDLVAGFNFDIGLGADRRRLETGDLDGGATVFHVGSQGHATDGGHAHRPEQFAAVQMFVVHGCVSPIVQVNRDKQTGSISEDVEKVNGRQTKS